MASSGSTRCPAGARPGRWLRLVGPRHPLDHGCAARHDSLPGQLVGWVCSPQVRDALDQLSVTGCWTDLGLPVRTPDGESYVRFWRDQQDCAAWYAALSDGHVAVLWPSDDQEAEVEAVPDDGGRDGDEWVDRVVHDVPGVLVRCALSVEEFGYRVWLESTLWRALGAEGGSARLPSHLRDYLHGLRRGLGHT